MCCGSGTRKDKKRPKKKEVKLGSEKPPYGVEFIDLTTTKSEFFPNRFNIREVG